MQLSKKWLAANACPKPWEYQSGVLEFAEGAVLELLGQIEDGPVFVSELLAEIKPHVPRRRRRWLYDADNDESAIERFLRKGLSNALDAFGSWRDDDAEASYLLIPQHGGFSSAYYRRRSATTVQELDVVIESKRTSRRRILTDLRLLEALRDKKLATV